MKTNILAVVGSKNSGKTKTIEVLTEELTKRGYRVTAVKHIPEPNFTIDKEGKDTWRFAQAGAKTIVSIASREITTIEKTDESNISLEEIVQRCKDSDVVLLEGFRKLVGKNKNIPKIVTMKSSEEALDASKTFQPILAFMSFYPTGILELNIPVMNILEDKEKIVDIVEKDVEK